MNQELIPTHTDAYDSLTFVHTGCACVYKKQGYTPLQVVKGITPYLRPEEAARRTYVGRLDPMAEGWMHILWNGNMEEKAQLASLDKTYEIDVVFGIQTDTGDALGLVCDTSVKNVVTVESFVEVIQSFVGSFTYPYPTYSSPNIKQTLKGESVEEKKQHGTIYSIEEVSHTYIKSSELQKEIEQKLSLCKMDGDFRLPQIQEAWKDFFDNHNEPYQKLTLRVCCSSGTYMRTLAEELGKKLGTIAFALGIRRIGVGAYKK